MNEYLDSRNLPSGIASEEQELGWTLYEIQQTDTGDGVFTMLGRYSRVLADNLQMRKVRAFERPNDRRNHISIYDVTREC